MGFLFMYEARKFNQRSYDDNDQYAKDIIIKYLTHHGFNIKSSAENYKHDIIAEKSGKEYYIEVEVKRNYPFTNEASFKFSSVSFTGRKERLHQEHGFKYVIICKETGWCVSCPSSVIYQDQHKETIDINTVDRSGRDQFFRVPKHLCTFTDLNL